MSDRVVVKHQLPAKFTVGERGDRQLDFDRRSKLVKDSKWFFGYTVTYTLVIILLLYYCYCYYYYYYCYCYCYCYCYFYYYYYYYYKTIFLATILG